MSVEQLRKQAKELVKAARGGDEDGLRRLGGREPILARAQLVIARECSRLGPTSSGTARRNTSPPGSDYVGVMELLVTAGAELETRFVDVAQGPLADWLLEAID